MSLVTKLKDLYSQVSKHSNYQILPSLLEGYLGSEQVEVNSRFEKERLNYIIDNVEVEGGKILDIGGNTGYFSLEMIAKGAQKVHYYEGNVKHADFVNTSSELLGIGEQIVVFDSYFDFDESIDPDFDVALLLNVLHHLGDDYGDSSISMVQAKRNMMQQLCSMANVSRYVVFQMGFCWKGNRSLLLFEKGLKEEMISFVTDGVRDCFEVVKIGISDDRSGIIHYCDQDERNVVRRDDLGEFLNRPIFVLKSRRL